MLFPMKHDLELIKDWGDYEPEDAAANELALMEGDRLLSIL